MDPWGSDCIIHLSFYKLARRVEFVPRIRLSNSVAAHLRSFDGYDRISVGAVLSQDDEPSVSGTGGGVSPTQNGDGVFSGSRRFSPSAGRECVASRPAVVACA